MTSTTAGQLRALQNLEHKLDRLVNRYQSLKNENLALTRQLQELTQEKALLLEKTDLAKNKVEAMIARLKTLEQNL